VGLSLFLLGAVGFAINGSNLYAQRQMAQAAADAAAQAQAMSILAGTNTFNSATSFTCDSSHLSTTPCTYAGWNGFNQTSDTVSVSISGTAPAGVSATCSPDYPTDCFSQVTAARTVNTTFMRFLGPTSSTVKAIAVAAITQITSPVPIIVAHPTLSQSFSLSGTGSSPNGKVIICGGQNGAFR